MISQNKYMIVTNQCFRPKPVLFKSDHSYPSYQATNITVILYGQLGTADFHDYHKELKQMAEDGRIQYILRHYVRVSTLIQILFQTLK